MHLLWKELLQNASACCLSTILFNLCLWDWLPLCMRYWLLVTNLFWIDCSLKIFSCFFLFCFCFCCLSFHLCLSVVVPYDWQVFRRKMCATSGWQTLGPRRCCCLCPSNRLPLPALSIQPSYESYGAPIDLGGVECTVEPPTPDECVVVTPPTPQDSVVRPATPQLVYKPP